MIIVIFGTSQPRPYARTVCTAEVKYSTGRSVAPTSPPSPEPETRHAPPGRRTRDGREGVRLGRHGARRVPQECVIGDRAERRHGEQLALPISVEDTRVEA